LSASATFVKLADVNSGTAAFLRCAIALVVLLPLAVWETRRRQRLDTSLLGHAIAAGVFLGVDYVMWTASILDVGAGIATVLINVQVIVFPALARIFGGTALPGRFLIVSPVMIGGVALAGGILSHSPDMTSPLRGSVLGIAAGVAYAAYLYLNRLSGQRSPAHIVTPVCVATAAAALTAGTLSMVTTGIDLSLTTASWGWITALALLGQVAAWLLISMGTRRLPPNTSAALLLLQPVMAIAFGLLILGETPTVSQFVGCAIVIAAVWLAHRHPRATDRRTDGT
jgi:drug/metabolite transporter (DMT)-like permease